MLYVCLGTSLLFTLARYTDSRCSSRQSKRLPPSVKPDALAAGLQNVVPDVTSYTSNVLPEVAKAVAQLEQQGQGRKVIAVSLYGDNPRYTLGAIANALLAKRDWAGWTYRVYHGRGVPADVLEAIQVGHTFHLDQ